MIFFDRFYKIYCKVFKFLGTNAFFKKYTFLFLPLTMYFRITCLHKIQSMFQIKRLEMWLIFKRRLFFKIWAYHLKKERTVNLYKHIVRILVLHLMKYWHKRKLKLHSNENYKKCNYIEWTTQGLESVISIKIDVLT